MNGEHPYRDAATPPPRPIQLGDLARDKISGFEGVVIGRTEWIYGCVRFTLQPRTLHDGKPIDALSFDEPQLELRQEAWIEGRREQLKPPPTSIPGPVGPREGLGGPRPEPRRGR